MCGPLRVRERRGIGAGTGCDRRTRAGGNDGRVRIERVSLVATDRRDGCHGPGERVAGVAGRREDAGDGDGDGTGQEFAADGSARARWRTPKIWDTSCSFRCWSRPAGKSRSGGDSRVVVGEPAPVAECDHVLLATRELGEQASTAVASQLGCRAVSGSPRRNPVPRLARGEPRERLAPTSQRAALVAQHVRCDPLEQRQRALGLQRCAPPTTPGKKEGGGRQVLGHGQSPVRRKQ